MKRKLILLVISSFSLIFLAAAVADDDWLSTLLSKLDTIKEKYPQEKVYLHLDKPYYSIGDDIWFKAYVVKAESNQLSALSKVLYVDLLNERDSVCKTMALPVADGLTNGDIYLTDSLFKAGNYHLKAYTRWMLNFGADAVFSKDLIIGDARKATGVIGNAKFSFSQQTKLHASINFLNVTDKSPLVGKQVSYNLLDGDKVVAGGKAITGAEGDFMVDLTLKSQYRSSNLFMQTNVTLGEKNTISRSFAVFDNYSKPDLQFFPEGGKLVMGLRSKVAFKAVSSNGSGADVKGVVVDQNNKVITEFSSAHAGMGVFTLQPMPGASYKAIIKSPAGADNTYAIPAAEEQGYTLSLDNTIADSVIIKVTSSKIALPGKEMAVVAMQNGVVRYSDKVATKAGFKHIGVSNLRFATGIVQVTLLTQSGEPVAERLIFVNHNDQLKMNLTTSKPIYGKREKVDMAIELKDDDDSPVTGALSVAITDGGKVLSNEDAGLSILANLLLTSDLKGHVEDPNYYFNQPNAEKARQLDNLLLTQGWRGFSWNAISAGTLPAIVYQPQQGISVTGKITTLDNKPVANGKVVLYASSASGLILLDTVADSEGNFSVNYLGFTGRASIVARAKNSKDNPNVKVTLTTQPTPSYTLYITPPLTTTASILSYLQSTQKRFEGLNYGTVPNTIALNEVKIRDTRVPDKNTIKGSSKLGNTIASIVIKKEK